MGDVFGGENFGGIFETSAGKFGGHAAGTDDAHADAISAQVFGHAPAQSLESPFGSAIEATTGKGVFSRERTDINDVPAAALNHERGDGAGDQKDAFEVGVEDEIPV